eukprot:Em0007g1539a
MTVDVDVLSCIEDSLKFCDDEVRSCLSSCLAVDIPDPNWTMAQLSPTFISSLAASGFGNLDNVHLQQAVTRFNSQVSPQDAITIEAILASPPPQSSLSKKTSDKSGLLLEIYSHVNMSLVRSIARSILGRALVDAGASRYSWCQKWDGLGTTAYLIQHSSSTSICRRNELQAVDRKGGAVHAGGRNFQRQERKTLRGYPQPIYSGYTFSFHTVEAAHGRTRYLGGAVTLVCRLQVVEHAQKQFKTVKNASTSTAHVPNWDNLYIRVQYAANTEYVTLQHSKYSTSNSNANGAVAITVPSPWTDCSGAALFITGEQYTMGVTLQYSKYMSATSNSNANGAIANPSQASGVTYSVSASGQGSPGVNMQTSVTPHHMPVCAAQLPLLPRQLLSQLASTDDTTTYVTAPTPLPMPAVPIEKQFPSSAIRREGLVSVEVVLAQNTKLKGEGKAQTLAQKLAKQCLFGEEVLKLCTPLGISTLPALPSAELMQWKSIMLQQFPQ